MSTLIVYACPTGELAEQLESYFAESRLIFENEAHRYPPHCTLTSFFEDVPESVGGYVDALDDVLRMRRSERPSRPVVIHEPEVEGHVHHLPISSPWLVGVAAEFVRQTKPIGRKGPILAKLAGLHLSLAYCKWPKELPQEARRKLAALARVKIDVKAPVGWEVRLYERREKVNWKVHGAWKLD